jgi:hypothetical protein
MPEKKFKLIFDGFWRDENIKKVPDKSGIYCVYSYSLDELNKKTKLKIHKLLYIGESDNANKSVSDHEKSKEFYKYAGDRQKICYSFAPLEKESRKIVRTALIITCNPQYNPEDIKKFVFDKTQISCEGQITLLKNEIIIEKNK